MTTMTTPNEQSEQDDVQGYFGPVVLVVASIISGGAMVGIGYTGPELQGTLKAVKPLAQIVGESRQTPR